MMMDFLRFAVILAVVMLGFATAFFALFETGSTWLNVFNAMLGAEFFQEFEGHEYEAAGTILLMAYLLVITILLLNLLIAVLSTSHANVQEHAEEEFKISKARFVQHYRMVVDEDLLPPPFNLIQVVLWLLNVFGKWLLNLFGKCKSPITEQAAQPTNRSNGFVGRFVFWLVLTPLVVSLGSVLWIVSAPFTSYWFRDLSFPTQQPRQDSPGMRKVGRCVGVFLWCVVGAPVCLVLLWVWMSCSGLFMWVNFACRHFVGSCRGASIVEHPPVLPQRYDEMNVNKMLKGAPGGLDARDLFRFIEDPMSDPMVRQDETTKPTKVEHIKLLRNRLEKRSGEQFASLREEVSAMVGGIKDQSARIEQRLEKVESSLACILEAVRSLPGAEPSTSA